MLFVDAGKETPPPPALQKMAHLEPGGASTTTATGTQGCSREVVLYPGRSENLSGGPRSRFKHKVSSKAPVYKVITIAPYYREGIVC